MATQVKFSLTALVVLLVTFLPFSLQQGILVTYWGQNGNEGSLATACQKNLYEIIILSFLSTFGDNQQPQLNLAGHCDPSSNGCAALSSDIQTCQSQGVKVLLSIGGGAGNYGLDSDQDAQNVASYLWDNYLGGNSGSGPLGAAVLDGIDFDIETGGSNYYATLAQTLRQTSTGSSKTYYLSAAPQCPYPDANLGPGSGTALATGLFDYLWVQFYNNEACEYSNDDTSLISAWNQWTSGVSSAKILLGLPASTDAASSGFIPADVLTSQVLPSIKPSSNYGGVMVWSYYYDQINNYGASIKGSL